MSRKLARKLLCTWVAGFASSAAVAAPTGDIAQQARLMLEDRVQAQAQALGARVAVKLDATLDERAARAPCTPDVFTPPGTRLWGKTTIGLRCAGSSWQVRVPVEVAMYTDVPMPIRPMPTGAVLQPGDWTLQEVNLAAWSRPLVSDADSLEGATVGRALRAGEPIPPDAIRARGRMGIGDPVQVILVGQGFTVKMAGKVLQAAEPGQSARVKLESGRTVAGVLRDDRAVEVQLSM